MKLVCQLLDCVVEITDDSVTGLVIENGKLFRELVEAMKSSIEYGDNDVILSEIGLYLEGSDRIVELQILYVQQRNNLRELVMQVF